MQPRLRKAREVEEPREPRVARVARDRRLARVPRVPRVLIPRRGRAPNQDAPNDMMQMPDVVIRHIFGKLSVHERIYLRGVCRGWKFHIEAQCGYLQYMKLDVTDRHERIKQPYLGTHFAPAYSMQRFLFERSWTEPELADEAKGVCTIPPDYITQDMIESVSALCANVHTLVIYFDFVDIDDDVEAFLALLPAFGRLESLSIIQCKNNVYRNSVATICNAVDRLRASLSRLDLCFCPVSNGDAYVRDYAIDLNLANVTRSVKQLTLPSRVTNLDDVLRRTGTDNSNGLISLTIDCTISPTVTRTQITKLFEANRQLGSVQQLQLKCVRLCDPARFYLEQFANVQQLTLSAFGELDLTVASSVRRTGKSELFNQEWIRSIARLRRLTALTLVSYTIKSHGQQSKQMNYLQLANIRKLTIGAYDFVSQFAAISNSKNITPRDVFNLIGRSIRNQFPGLEELAIYAAEDEKYCFLSRQLHIEIMLCMPQLRVLKVDLGEENLNERS